MKAPLKEVMVHQVQMVNASADSESLIVLQRRARLGDFVWRTQQRKFRLNCMMYVYFMVSEYQYINFACFYVEWNYVAGFVFKLMHLVCQKNNWEILHWDTTVGCHHHNSICTCTWSWHKIISKIVYGYGGWKWFTESFNNGNFSRNVSELQELETNTQSLLTTM